MSDRQIFSGMQILSGDKWLTEHAVIVEDNVIKGIIPIDMIKNHLPAKHHRYENTCYLIPGMMDLHVHGANGKDVMDASEEALSTISDALLREGVTSYLATTMTADNQQIENALTAIASYKQKTPQTNLFGVHLEGPFISPDKTGAHLKKYLQAPNQDLVKQWQTLSGKSIRLLTLAPELPGAIDFIKAIKTMGIAPSVGHTNATYEQTCDAIAVGCTHATHLFNAMTGIHQRAPGAVGALLLANEVHAELIVDGMHLHPAIVKLAYDVKTRQRTLLVTDAIRAKCMGDGSFDLGGQKVTVLGGRATLKDGTIAGSTLTLPQAVKNMVTFTGCTLPEALQMVTANPAHSLGVIKNKGSIEVGKDADLVVLDAELNVMHTILAGEMRYSAG